MSVSIPLEQGGVFRHLLSRQIALFGACFNPFGAGRGLSTKVKKWKHKLLEVSIPLEQGRVFRQRRKSWWRNNSVSIPLEQGRVFRHQEVIDFYVDFNVSIPLDQGRVFRPKYKIINLEADVRFNPFGPGQGLSTESHAKIRSSQQVSIPLDQGRVFRLQGWFGALVDKAWEDRFPTFPLMRKVRCGFD